MAYVDDVVFLAHGSSQLATMMEEFCDEAEDWGLQVNPGKSCFWSPTSSLPILHVNSFAIPRRQTSL
eukprot:5816262-Prorocentrum_lima.AAC.1